MSNITEKSIWRNTVGPNHSFVVEKIFENGWVNGKQVKTDENGKLIKTAAGEVDTIIGTAFMAHCDTMLRLMEKVQ